MKTAGIIAEYNPFHNGHQFHIEETRRRTGADYIIAVISGDFVQRGTPALLSKYDRARMALLHGADLVFALPATTALSSAEGFASGAVSLLAGLGVTDVISFGCESADTDPLLFQEVAAILAEEPEEFRDNLTRCMKNGMSFPEARELAIAAYMQNHTPKNRLQLTDQMTLTDQPAPTGPASNSARQTELSRETAVRRLLSEPNNILALEYAKAVIKNDCAMDLCMISRRGSSYHSHELTGAPEGSLRVNAGACSREDSSSVSEASGLYASAAAIRNHLLAQTACSAADTNPYAASALQNTVPPDVFRTLRHAHRNHQLLCEDDFSDLLHYALIANSDHLNDFGLPGPDLAHRTVNLLEEFESWTQYATLLKTRNRTYTAISRYLTHLLLQIRREDFALAETCNRAPYARLLGFHKSAAPLLTAIRNHSEIPVLTRLAGDATKLNENQKHLLDLDTRSSEIYKRILYTKSGCILKSEYRQPTICLP